MKKPFIVGTLLAIALTSCAVKENMDYTPYTPIEEVVYEPTTTTVETLEVVKPYKEIKPAVIPEVIEETVEVETVEEVIEVESTVVENVESATFRVTAYCPCEICCGSWALNRPVDENGNVIVYGAASKPLTSGVSCASPLPFGTEIDLGELGTVVVEDRTAGWVVEKHGNYIIDLYLTDHEQARAFGVQWIEGVIR